MAVQLESWKNNQGTSQISKARMKQRTLVGVCFLLGLAHVLCTPFRPPNLKASLTKGNSKIAKRWAKIILFFHFYEQKISDSPSQNRQRALTCSLKTKMNNYRIAESQLTKILRRSTYSKANCKDREDEQ